MLGRAVVVADVQGAFVAAGSEDKDRVYVSDHVHLSHEGHELIARAVVDAIEAAGRSEMPLAGHAAYWPARPKSLLAQGNRRSRLTAPPCRF